MPDEDGRIGMPDEEGRIGMLDEEGRIRLAGMRMAGSGGPIAGPVRGGRGWWRRSAGTGEGGVSRGELCEGRGGFW
jgi:hypothetical protein